MQKADRGQLPTSSGLPHPPPAQEPWCPHPPSPTLGRSPKPHMRVLWECGSYSRASGGEGVLVHRTIGRGFLGTYETHENSCQG